MSPGASAGILAVQAGLLSVTAVFAVCGGLAWRAARRERISAAEQADLAKTFAAAAEQDTDDAARFAAEAEESARDAEAAA